jgi:tetratricopeptide (TPR) repeat protein
VLEVGVGLGLFARGFLDALRELCQARGKDYYERLLYVATDASVQMLDDLSRHGLLNPHAGRYVLRHADALHLEDADASPGGPRPCGYHAAFLNYVLDSLPAAVLRIDGRPSPAMGARSPAMGAAASQLCVRTSLARGVDLGEFTQMGLEEVMRRARSSDPAERAALVELSSLFALEYDFRPVAPAEVPYGTFAARLAPPGQYVLHNHGAIQCLEEVLARLRDGGFALISDYGQAGSIARPDPWEHQRFGFSCAIGLNFDLLQAYFREIYGCEWLSPPADWGGLSCRLLSRGVDEAAAGGFRRLFDKSAHDWAHQPLEEARAHAQQGRVEAALAAFSLALQRLGSNWVVLDEIARFLIYTANDYARGLEIAQLALSIHPVSPELWNTCGDALYYLGRTAEAHQAFLRALDLNPDEPRTYLDLTYTFAARKDHASALRMVAEGLRCDDAGTCRDGLLRQQESILSALTRRRQQEQRCLAVRSGSNRVHAQQAAEPSQGPEGLPGGDVA